MAKRIKAISGSTSLETSVEVIGSNVDLLSDLILRVPSKSLLTFKSVSKYWLHLISDSLFASNHSHRNCIYSISGLYFYYSYAKPVKSLSLHSYQNPPPSLSFLDTVRQGFPIKIQNSCNGLLLCINDRTLGNPYNYKLSVIVCNPTTQKYTLLPQLPECEFLAGFLAFDPSKSPHYRVVLYHPYDEFEIYSSETASWKLVIVSVPLGIRVKGVFWNGAIHRLKDGDGEFHFRFDVDEKLIKAPISPEPKTIFIDDISYYGECGGNFFC